MRMCSPAPRRSVLVVDDHDAVRRALARELGQEFEVLVADGPAAARRTLEIKAGIIAVVSDLMMPEPSGLELLADVRDRWAGCVRVLVSGALTPEQAEPIRRAGVAHLVVLKPWRYGELLAALKKALGEP
jgi:two-component system response regulator HupR/HoxA